MGTCQPSRSTPGLNHTPVLPSLMGYKVKSHACPLCLFFQVFSEEAEFKRALLVALGSLSVRDTAQGSPAASLDPGLHTGPWGRHIAEVVRGLGSVPAPSLAHQCPWVCPWECPSFSWRHWFLLKSMFSPDRDNILNPFAISYTTPWLN